MTLDEPMFMAYLSLAASTAESDLMPFLMALGVPPLNAWLEDELRPDGLQLRDDVTLDAAALLIRTWPRGRLFAASGDLRWERFDDGSVHLAIVATTPPPHAQGQTPLAPIDSERSDEYLLLWGERRAGSWREQRIPNLSGMYPEHWQGPFAAIRARTYEAPWEVETAGRDVRVVTRYQAYVGDYDPPPDARFRRADEEEQQ